MHTFMKIPLTYMKWANYSVNRVKTPITRAASIMSHSSMSIGAKAGLSRLSETKPGRSEAQSRPQNAA